MTTHDGDELDALVHRADLDGLVRLIDAATASREWATLRAVRDRCRAAVHTGRQVWPGATLAEYRLALWAPPEWAAQVLDDESGRFTIGPLTEVAAQHHTYHEVADHLPDLHRRGVFAHERAVRGEEIPPAAPNPLDIPFTRQSWEPHYALATYADDGLVDDPPPPPSAGQVTRLGDTRRDETDRAQREALVDDPDVESAVRQLLDTWTSASNGRVEVRCVEGEALDAIRALGVVEGTARRMTLAEAIAWLAWAGATGAAHGRRRGAAIGRFGAWWLLAALVDLDEWPPDRDELARRAAALRWWWWDDGTPPLGWQLRLAVDDPSTGYAWAVSAVDAD